MLCAYWSSGTVMEKVKKRKNICMRKYILGSRVSFGIRDLPFQKNVLKYEWKICFQKLVKQGLYSGETIMANFSLRYPKKYVKLFTACIFQDKGNKENAV